MPRIAAIIVALILERPTCLDCLAPKAGINIGDAETALREVGDVFRILDAPDRCRVCGETKETIVLER